LSALVPKQIGARHLLRSKNMKLHSLDRSRYAPELLTRVATGWRRLSSDERHGVLNAARVAADLARLDAPPAILVLAAHVVQDEIHHLEVCERVPVGAGDGDSLEELSAALANRILERARDSAR